MSRDGRRITGLLLTYYYANPTQCTTGVAFGGSGGLTLSASISTAGAFSGVAAQGTARLTGVFSHAGRTASGVIDYNQPAGPGSAGCGFKLPFNVHVAPTIPRGASVAPKGRAKYRGETYQADSILIRVSSDGRKISDLKSTASLRCRNPYAKLEQFDLGPYSLSGHGKSLAARATYTDKEGAHVTLDISGRFVGAHRIAAGTLRVRATHLPGSPCDSGTIPFVAHTP